MTTKSNCNNSEIFKTHCGLYLIFTLQQIKLVPQSEMVINKFGLYEVKGSYEAIRDISNDLNQENVRGDLIKGLS